jgi:hypothetical protein
MAGGSADATKMATFRTCIRSQKAVSGFVTNDHQGSERIAHTGSSSFQCPKNQPNSHPAEIIIHLKLSSAAKLREEIAKASVKEAVASEYSVD